MVRVENSRVHLVHYDKNRNGHNQDWAVASEMDMVDKQAWAGTVVLEVRALRRKWLARNRWGLRMLKRWGRWRGAVLLLSGRETRVL